MTIKIGVNGYGTIGKRIVDAIRKIEGFELIGITKYSVDYSALLVNKMGIDIYTPREKFTEFKKIGIELVGALDDLVDNSDIVIDASPAKQGIVFEI